MNYLGGNNIGVKGCEDLTKTDYKFLTKLFLRFRFCYLDINDIKDAGCEYLAKCNWSNLTQIKLC